MTTTLFGQPSMSLSSVGDAGPYTLGTHFHVTADSNVQAVWYYSASDASSLPSEIGLYAVSGQVLVHSETASWSGALGSGWVRAAFSSPPAITAGISYVIAILNPDTGHWYVDTDNYWSVGPGASGITNGILVGEDDAHTGGSEGQGAFAAGGTWNYPNTHYEAENWWIDLEVGSTADVFTGAIKLKKMVISSTSHEKNVASGSVKLKKMVIAITAAPVLVVTFVSTTAGVDTYTTVSPINGNSATLNMRVFAPVSPNPGYPHAFLWLLPVEYNQDTTYGDSVQTVKDLGANDEYNLTCIQPGFGNSPWYGDNIDDPHTQDETFFMKLVAWADANLATTGTEKHYLIGFSKSGFGGQAIFWRHQPKFSAVASWDTACDLQLLSDHGGDATSSFGEQSQLDLSKLYNPNLTTWKAEGDTATVNRIYLAAGIDLITPTSDYSDRLTADGILHSYTFVEADSHQWAPTPGWVGPALASIMPSPGSSTGAIKLKKMVISSTSHEKNVASGAVKLKKMVLVASPAPVNQFALARYALQTLLESLIAGVHVYFQPPPNLQMVYPAIVYNRDYLASEFADNIPYSTTFRWQVTVIDTDPDSPLHAKLVEMPMMKYVRHYTSDNLNHDIYDVYF